MTNTTATQRAMNNSEGKSTGKLMEVTVTTIGTSAGIILPKAALQELHVEKGQKLFITQAPGSGLRISRHNPEFGSQMRHAYEAMDLFPDALKELAK